MIFTYIFNVHNFWRQERRRIRLSFHLLQTLHGSGFASCIFEGLLPLLFHWVSWYTLIVDCLNICIQPWKLQLQLQSSKYRCCGRAPSEILPYFLRQWTYYPIEFSFSLYWSCKVKKRVYFQFWVSQLLRRKNPQNNSFTTGLWNT